MNLNLGVEFALGKGGGLGAPYAGTTRNVSAGGVYLEVSEPRGIENGMDLILKIAVPKRTEDSPDPFVLHCEGTICRIEYLPNSEGGQERLGLAVKFNNRPNVKSCSLSDLVWS